MPENAVEVNKPQVDYIILEIIKRLTSPISVTEMNKRLYRRKEMFRLDDTLVAIWMKQLHRGGYLKSVYLKIPDDNAMEECFEIV